MRIKLRLVAVGLAFVVPVMATPVLAEDVPSESSEAKIAERQQRVEERKTQQQAKLETARAERVAAKCQSAQAKLASRKETAAQVATKRAALHGRWSEKLTLLASRLDQKSVPTEDLRSQIAELNAKAAEFDRLQALYLQTLEDASQLDCTADPTGFMASLASAREQLVSLRASAQQVREYATTTIVQTLANLKSMVDDGSSAETPVNSEQ